MNFGNNVDPQDLANELGSLGNSTFGGLARGTASQALFNPELAYRARGPARIARRYLYSREVFAEIPAEFLGGALGHPQVTLLGTGEPRTGAGLAWWDVFVRDPVTVGTAYNEIERDRIGIDMGSEAARADSIDNLVNAAGRFAAYTQAFTGPLNFRYSVRVEIKLDGKMYESLAPRLQANVSTTYVTVAMYPDDLSRSRDDAADQLATVLKVEIVRLLNSYGEANFDDLFIPVKFVRISLRRAPRAGVGRGSEPSKSGIVMQLQRAASKWVEWSPSTSHRCLYKSVAFALNLFSRNRKREHNEGSLAPLDVREFLEASTSNQKKWNNGAAHTKSLAKEAWSRIYTDDDDPEFPAFGADYAVVQVLASLYNITIRIYGTNFRLLSEFKPSAYPHIKLQRCPKLPPYSYGGAKKNRILHLDTLDLRLHHEHYSVLIPRVCLSFYHEMHQLEDFNESEHLPLTSTSVHRELRRCEVTRSAKYGISSDPNVPLNDTHDEYDISGSPIPMPRFQQGVMAWGTARDQKMRLLSCDIETYLNEDNEHIPYAIGMAYWCDDLDDLVYKTQTWYGADCIDLWLAWLCSGEELDATRLNGSYMVFHNGGRYDVAAVLSRIIRSSMHKWKLIASTLVENNTRIIGFSMNCAMKLDDGRAKQVKLKFRDSFAFLSQSLRDLCHSFKLDSFVSKGDIPHERVTGDDRYRGAIATENSLIHWADMIEDGWDDGRGGGKNLMGSRRYLELDVISLLIIMSEYSADIYELCGFELCSCLTAASVAKRLYFTKYHNKLGISPRNHLFTPSSDCDEVIRYAYMGGRCESHVFGAYNPHQKPELNGRVYYYDYTSLYPYVAAKNPIPGGAPIAVDKPVLEAELKNGTFFGFIVCDVWNDMDVVAKLDELGHLPVHGVFFNGRLTFPWIKKKTRLVITSIAYYDAEKYLKGAYCYNHLWGIKFRPEMLMSDYMTSLVEKKAIARKEGKTALAAACKTTANSGYGWSGLNWSNKDAVAISRADDDDLYEQLLTEERLVSVSQLGDYRLMRCRRDLPHDRTAVQAAAFISAYGRSQLYSLIYDLIEVGGPGSVLYTDTDSVQTTVRLSDHPVLQQRYQWDGTGAALGSLKNELSLPGDQAFDTGCWAGCKFYSLARMREGEKKFEECHIKGYQRNNNKKLTIQSFIKLFENKALIDAHFEERPLIHKRFREALRKASSAEEMSEIEQANQKEIEAWEERCDELGVIRNKSVVFSFSRNSMLDTHTYGADGYEEKDLCIRTRYLQKQFKPIYNKGIITSDLLEKLNNEVVRIRPLVFDGENTVLKEPDAALAHLLINASA